MVKVFVWGMIISALGTLPLGSLNVISMQLSVAEGYRNAILFALGVAIIEIIYVRVSLVGMEWVQRQKKVFKWLEWIALLIVTMLAVGSFMAAMKPKGASNVIISNHMQRFLFGVVMSAINPVQIPFWFGWSTVLFSKKILLPRNSYYNAYIIGIGIGTLLGHSVFIYGGQVFIHKLNENVNLVNYALGAVFAFTAIVQLVKIIRRKGVSDAIEKTTIIH